MYQRTVRRDISSFAIKKQFHKGFFSVNLSFAFVNKISASIQQRWFNQSYFVRALNCLDVRPKVRLSFFPLEGVKVPRMPLQKPVCRNYKFLVYSHPWDTDPKLRCQHGVAEQRCARDVDKEILMASPTVMKINRARTSQAFFFILQRTKTHKKTKEEHLQSSLGTS